jgi:hypothetical protein
MNAEIKNIDGFFWVLSPAGKRLGGPYATMAEADLRRSQVDEHVEKAKGNPK